MLQKQGKCYMEKQLSYAKTELTKALLSLLEKKSLSEITVSELCNEAGLSRLSFYRNYDSMEEIIREHLTGITDTFLASTDANFRTTPREEFITLLFEHMYGIKELVSLLIDNNLSYLLKEDGEAVGYLIYQDNKTETGAHLTVKDLAFIGRKGFLAILGFLARFQADYEKITLFLPRDLELLSVIQSPNAYAIQKRGRQEYMARIINAKELLSRMRKPDGTSFVIRITDDIIRENEGTFLVEGKKVMQTQEKPDLIVSERALAQLVTGSVSLQESSYREDVEICDKTAVLETVFVSKPILVEDHF